MRRGGGSSNNRPPQSPAEDGDASHDNAPTAITNPETSPNTQPAGGTSAGPNPYEHSIKTIATVNTVEEFWRVYDFLVRPNELPTTTDYHFFRSGIKPTWEDPGNVKGGKWIVRLRKGLSSRYWEEILLGMIGGQFAGVPDGEICGAVVSIRYSEDIVSVWNRRADDRESTDKIRDAIKKILRLPSGVHMEYKPHQTSLQDKSSFRNTTVWKPKDRGGDRGRGLNEDRGDQRRSNSWGEREKPKRDIERSWR